MRRVVCFSFVLALVLLSVGQVGAQTLPGCQLGTALAVDPTRVLVSGEQVIQVAGGPVTISQRESHTSSRIVFRRCLLPATEVVVGGAIPWVKKCGNTFWPEGWSLPVTPAVNVIRGEKGEPGPQGPAGERGPRGFKGEPGKAGKDFVKPNHSHKKLWIITGIVGGAAVGYATYYFWPCPPGTVRR